jgi:pilus assembly protein Flp/PilA
MMKGIASKVARFLKSEDGPTAVEYAVMVSLVIVAALATIKGLGTGLNTTFGNISTELGAGAAGP